LPQDVTIIYFHGNAETLADIDSLMFSYANAFQCRVVAIDYGGYGMSDGHPSEREINRDALHVWRYVQARFPGTKVVLWGRSIGTVCACYLASHISRHALAAGQGSSVGSAHAAASSARTSGDLRYGGLIGLILQSPLASAFNVVRYMRRGVPLDCFLTYRRIRSVVCPVFIIHGVADNVVPVWNTYRILQSLSAHLKLREPPDWGDMALPLTGRQLYLVETNPADAAVLESLSAPNTSSPREGRENGLRITDTCERQLGGARYFLIRGASHNDIDCSFPRQLVSGVHGFLSSIISHYKRGAHGLRYYWKKYLLAEIGQDSLQSYVGGEPSPPVEGRPREENTSPNT